MSGIPHDHYEPSTRRRNSGCTSGCQSSVLMYDTLMIPTPKNLNWMWIWGIVLDLLPGCCRSSPVSYLAMHYTPQVDMAFASSRAHHAQRERRLRCCVTCIMNGASLFFCGGLRCTSCVVFTTASYKAPREVTWIVGMLIYLLMMANGVHGLRSPLGADVLLGCHRDHWPVWCDPAGW